MSTDWIKMSERNPTEADFPIFAYFPEGNFIEPFKDAFCFSIRSCNVRHWQKVDIPAPPLPDNSGPWISIEDSPPYNLSGKVEFLMRGGGITENDAGCCGYASFIKWRPITPVWLRAIRARCTPAK